jgi:signal transduction histidine kinase
MKHIWSSISISYKIFISLLVAISIGEIFILIYIWQYESKILTQKEYIDLKASLSFESKTIDDYLTNLKKETTFLASLEVMDDFIAKDVDKRVSKLLKQKADDLGSNIVLFATINRKIIASSHNSFINRDFKKDMDRYLYFQMPVYASFNPKRILGEIVLQYPLKNLTDLQTTKGRILWLTPLEDIKIDKRDYLLVSKKLRDWKINLAYKKSDAFKTVEDIKKMLILSFIFALILLSITVWIISKNLLKGVKRLSKTSKEIIETEDYTKQVIVESNDEIGELSNSFNTLISQTNSLLSKLDTQSKTHLNNLIELISFFNTITKTKDADTTKKIARERLKEFAKHDKRFLDATTNMIDLQLERISLLDKTKKALDAKTMFLSTISHELRTPLGSILNLTQHLMISKNLNDEDIKMLSKIETSATHLLNLINNILEISKLESNSLIVHKQNINLKELFEEIMEMIEPLAIEKDLTLIKEVDLTKEMILTDPQLFKQVAINILSNALKYTEKGSIKVILKDNYLKIIDTGIGIDKELLPHIFKEFYQSSVDIKHLKNSSGLGLALSKKVALLLEGDLRIFSQGRDKGVEVIFTF